MFVIVYENSIVQLLFLCDDYIVSVQYVPVWCDGQSMVFFSLHHIETILIVLFMRAN